MINSQLPPKTTVYRQTHRIASVATASTDIITRRFERPRRVLAVTDSACGDDWFLRNVMGQYRSLDAPWKTYSSGNEPEQGCQAKHQESSELHF